MVPENCETIIALGIGSYRLIAYVEKQLEKNTKTRFVLKVLGIEFEKLRNLTFFSLFLLFLFELKETV